MKLDVHRILVNMESNSTTKCVIDKFPRLSLLSFLGYRHRFESHDCHKLGSLVSYLRFLQHTNLLHILNSDKNISLLVILNL